MFSYTFLQKVRKKYWYRFDCYVQKKAIFLVQSIPEGVDEVKYRMCDINTSPQSAVNILLSASVLEGIIL